jgi:hypothetical protein
MITTLFFLLTAPFARAAELPPLPGMGGGMMFISTETASAPAEASKPVEAPKPAETPKPVESPKLVEVVRSTEIAKPVEAPKPAETKPAAAGLMPPKVPARPKGTLETAGEVARDLAIRVEYFEHGQSYYRAYTKGFHGPEENKAFVKFLEDYENELGIARRTHAILGLWLDKKSSIKD